MVSTSSSPPPLLLFSLPLLSSFPLLNWPLGEERRSETPTPEQGEEEGEGREGGGGGALAHQAPDPWADFNQPTTKKGSYSSSDRCGVVKMVEKVVVILLLLCQRL